MNYQKNTQLARCFTKARYIDKAARICYDYYQKSLVQVGGSEPCLHDANRLLLPTYEYNHIVLKKHPLYLVRHLHGARNLQPDFPSFATGTGLWVSVRLEEELLKFCDDDEIAALPFVQDIERDIALMPKGYGEAFRYILYRELKACRSMSKSRVKMFKMLARQSIQPEICDPRFIAKRA